MESRQVCWSDPGFTGILPSWPFRTLGPRDLGSWHPGTLGSTSGTLGSTPQDPSRTPPGPPGPSQRPPRPLQDPPRTPPRPPRTPLGSPRTTLEHPGSIRSPGCSSSPSTSSPSPTRRRRLATSSSTSSSSSSTLSFLALEPYAPFLCAALRRVRRYGLPACCTRWCVPGDVHRAVYTGGVHSPGTHPAGTHPPLHASPLADGRATLKGTVRVADLSGFTIYRSSPHASVDRRSHDRRAQLACLRQSSRTLFASSPL